MRPDPVSQWAMNAHIGLCFASALSTVSPRDRLAVWRVDHRHALRLRVKGIRRQLLRGGSLHADGQRVDAGEGAVGKGHDLVAGQDERQHAVEPRKARAGDAVGVDVLGPPQLAQHLLGFEHAAENVLLHVIGDAGLGEALQHARIGVPRPWAGGKRLGDVKLRINRHFRNPHEGLMVGAQIFGISSSGLEARRQVRRGPVYAALAAREASTWSAILPVSSARWSNLAVKVPTPAVADLSSTIRF